MTVPVLADENVDHRVVHRLEHYGVDVEHVDFAAELEKGCPDSRIAEYSSETGRVVLTNDDDFLGTFDSGDLAGILFVEDESLSPSSVADIVSEILGATDDPQGRAFYVSENWL
jgi:predicted nuclease of predicted toxin-antitoxin system